MTVLTLALPFLEEAINRYLTLDPESEDRLAMLNGKVMAVEMQGFGTPFYVIASLKKISLTHHFDGTPHVILTGGPFSLARVGLSSGSSKNFFGQGVKISGDVEVSQEFKALFDEMEIDWEEYLSRATGDVIAHQVSELFRQCTTFGEKITKTLRKDFTEVLQEELRYFPPREEIADFLAEVDALRHRTEHLQVKIAHLGKQHP